MGNGLGNWWGFTDAENILAHLDYSLACVRDLPVHACDASDHDLLVRNACRESFYMHARTVAEFFSREPDRRDWSARDFMPEWTAPRDHADTLGRVWDVASKNIAHLSRERVPDDAESFQPEDTSLAGLNTIARDCFRIVAAFVLAYREAPERPEHLTTFESFLSGDVVRAWVDDLIDLAD